MFKSFLTLLWLTLSFFLFPSSSLAQTKDWSGKCVSTIDPEVATIQGLECLFYNAIQAVSAIAGLVFFVMFVINGFNYLFSGGDQKKLAQVNASLTMSVIGLIGIALSWLIIKLIENFTGVNVTDFVIPGP